MRRTSAPLWAITSYFNPTRSRRRYVNYRAFQAHIAVPLITVELGFGECELGEADADVLVQLSGRDLIWQKERLLNLALTRLPSECRMVAWLDSDVLFLEDEWPELTLEALGRWPVVQPFLAVQQAGPIDDHRSLPAPRRAAWSPTSLASRMLEGSVPGSIFNTTGSSQSYDYAPGYAWAARRELIEDIGFYDAFILGCGDKALASAAYGRFEDSVRVYRLTEAHADHYRSWARSFHRRVGGRVGFVDCGLLHLWHGDPMPRATRTPYDHLGRFDFSPVSDMRIDRNGAWRWNSHKPAMHRYVADSLYSRCTDCDDLAPLEALG